MQGADASNSEDARRTNGEAPALISAGLQPRETSSVRKILRWRRSTFLRTTAWLGIALLLLFSRCPVRLLHPQLYAEDATLFFRGAIIEGLPSIALVQPRVGYLLLVPQLFAYFCRPLPWEWMPTAYALAASAGLLYVVWRLYSARLPVVVALVSSLALLSVPQNAEVWMTLCCLHFALSALLVVNVLEPPPITVAESWRRGIEMAAAALTCPEIAALAPAMIWWAWRNRSEKLAARMMTGALAATAIQLFIMAAYPRSVDLNLRQVVGTFDTALLGYSGFFFGGAGNLGMTTRQLIIGLMAPVCVLFALMDRSNRHRLTAVMLLLLAAGLMILGRVGNISHLAMWPRPLGDGGRYTYLPFVLAFWALGWLLAGAIHYWGEGRRLMVVAAAIPLILVPLSAARHWAPLSLPDYHWAQQVREARTGKRTVFEVPPGWQFPVPAAKAR